MFLSQGHTLIRALTAELLSSADPRCRLEALRLLPRLHGHTSPVSCVAVSAEDELIASGGDEGKAVLYSRRTQGKSSYLVGKEQDNVLLRQSRQDEAMGW